MSEHGSVLSLARQWRDHAATLREYGATAQADVLERCAAELQEGVREWEAEPLTLTQAADLSGYSADHLGRLVRDGAIPNAGRPGAPRILRHDLPLKSGSAAAPPASKSVPNRTQIVRSAIDAGD